MVDLTKPTINYAPAQGSTITDNTTLTITSTDDKINGSSTATITWTSSDGNATWNTTVNYNGTWTGTLNGLNANLTDGTITATINAQDWAGNQRTDTINSWTLNTTTATSIFALNYSTGMVKVGKLPPHQPFDSQSHHQPEARSQQPHSTPRLAKSEASNPETTQKSWGWPGSSSTLTSGQIWINVTTTDAFNRTTVDTYTYLIDGEVTSTPTLSIIGSNAILANQTLLGPNSRLRLGNLVDAGGVGFSQVQCYKNGQSSPTIHHVHHRHHTKRNCRPNHNFTISCRIKDQVGNYGPYTNFSGWSTSPNQPSTTLLLMDQPSTTTPH